MQKFTYLLLEDPDELRSYLAGFSRDEPVMADTESTGLSIFADLLGFSFYQHGYVEPAFVPVFRPYHERGIVLSELVTILNEWIPLHTFVFQNSGYDLEVMQINGFVEPKVIGETTALMHLSDTTIIKNLETRVAQDFGIQKEKFEAIIKCKWENIVWDKTTRELFSIETLAEYAAADAYWLHFIYVKYFENVRRIGTMKVHDKIELPLTYIGRDMRHTGILINKSILYALERSCQEELNQLEDEVYQKAGFVFNLRSSKQKAEIFYDRLGYKCPGVTPKGGRSTDVDALANLAYEQGCEAAKVLIEHSSLSTLQSSFIKSIPLLVDKDGRLRCSLNSTGTETGRYSCAKPNLQNQPNNKKYPVRQAFIAPPGKRLVILDYSQVELRIAAHLSKDEKLIQAFLSGRDVHQEVADQLGIERDDAKAVNFGILYGLGPKSLAFQIKKSEAYAKEMQQNYYDTYSGIKDWKKYVEGKAKQQGYIANMFGRIRPLLKIHSASPKDYYSALRQAVNTVVQGSAADIMKLAMIRSWEAYKVKKIPGAAILLTVHDELMFECDERYAEDLFYMVKRIMEEVTPLRVPLIAEGKICDNWAQMKSKTFLGYQDARMKHGIDPMLLHLLTA